MSASIPSLLTLEGVSKHYPLAKGGRSAWRHLWQVWSGRRPALVHQALQDITLDLQPGDALGVIGVNGAGKSTLLKLIAGVVAPSEGHVRRRGRVAALLELGAGFHPEHSGRDNVMLACALMGLSRAQAREQMAAIEAFADIGPAIEQPVKHYSSGMVVRLGFAVATCVTPDLLITDEVLAVGDESFQKKCMAWMERYRAEGGALLLCSHSMYHVQKLCRQALWLESGRVRMLGPAMEVSRAYLAWHEEEDRRRKEAADATRHPAQAASGIYQVRTMQLNGCDSTEPVMLPSRGALTVEGLVQSPDGRRPQVAVGIVRADGTPVYGVVSEMDGHVLAPAGDGLFQYALTFHDLPLLPGRYLARSHAMDPEGMRLFDHVERPFEVGGESRELGLVHLHHRWHSDSSPS